MAAILELIWYQNPKIKMAISQKLSKIQISNLRFFFWVEEEQLVWKQRKSETKVCGPLSEMTWNDPHFLFKFVLFNPLIISNITTVFIPYKLQNSNL